MVTLVMIHVCGGIPVHPQLFMIDRINQATLIFNSSTQKHKDGSCLCATLCVYVWLGDRGLV